MIVLDERNLELCSFLSSVNFNMSYVPLIVQDCQLFLPFFC